MIWKVNFQKSWCTAVLNSVNSQVQHVEGIRYQMDKLFLKMLLLYDLPIDLVVGVRRFDPMLNISFFYNFVQKQIKQYKI
jgi:hypothetical protein